MAFYLYGTMFIGVAMTVLGGWFKTKLKKETKKKMRKMREPPGKWQKLRESSNLANLEMRGFLWVLTLFRSGVKHNVTFDLLLKISVTHGQLLSSFFVLHTLAGKTHRSHFVLLSNVVVVYCEKA